MTGLGNCRDTVSATVPSPECTRDSASSSPRACIQSRRHADLPLTGPRGQVSGLTFLIAMAVASCHHAAAPIIASPLLTASVSGHVALQFRGAAYYLITSATVDPDRRDFQVFSTSEVDSAKRVTITFTHFGGVPSAGRLAIGSPAVTFAALQGVHALLFIEGRIRQELFASTEGTLTVTEVTPRTVTGTFSFQAVRYCLRDDVVVAGLCDPRLAGSTGPAVVVNGAFAAEVR